MHGSFDHTYEKFDRSNIWLLEGLATGSGSNSFEEQGGYVVDNCVACCKIHNRMKWDMSESDFLAECRRVSMFTQEKTMTEAV